jgi:hypothetical protein
MGSYGKKKVAKCGKVAPRTIGKELGNNLIIYSPTMENLLLQ